MTHLLRVLQAQTQVQANVMYKIQQLNVRAAALASTLGIDLVGEPEEPHLLCKRHTECLRWWGADVEHGRTGRLVSQLYSRPIPGAKMRGSYVVPTGSLRVAADRKAGR